MIASSMSRSVAAVANAASQGVLARNGFTRVGESIDPEDGPMIAWRLGCAR